jgi:hypothetical protein
MDRTLPKYPSLVSEMSEGAKEVVISRYSSNKQRICDLQQLIPSPMFHIPVVSPQLPPFVVQPSYTILDAAQDS